jgi:acetyltransferase-like isoleucine patch superfamily enzyme
MTAPNSQMRAHLPHPAMCWAVNLWHRARGVDVDRSAVIYRKASLLRFPARIRIGADVVVKDGAHLCPCRATATVQIGDRTTIGFHTFVYASERITIGQDCMVAPFVYIVDSNHGNTPGIPMNRQPNQTAPVTIGDDVWIGSGSIIAAGAVVSGLVPDNAIMGGVPAREISRRS